MLCVGALPPTSLPKLGFWTSAPQRSSVLATSTKVDLAKARDTKPRVLISDQDLRTAGLPKG
jgi:hypothetical protein